MKRRWLCGLASFAMLVCAAPSATSAPSVPGDGPYRVQMVYRTGTSLGAFDIDIVASSDSDFGMWFAVELVREKNRWVERTGTGFTEYREIAGVVYPTVYGNPAMSTVPSCPAAPACAAPVPLDGSRSRTVKPLASSRYYVVSTHANVQIKVNNKGWRVKDVPNPGVRRIFGHRANAVGVRTSSLVAEHFTSASAAGGRYGSSVLAYVPCERGGQGKAVLTGRGADTGDGIPPQALQCASTSAYFYEYAHSKFQTAWHLAGDVVGVGSLNARLFVFDFPKP